MKDWKQRAKYGEFLTRSLTMYFIWNPEAHRRVMAAAGTPWSGAKNATQSFSPFKNTCITRERAQHEAILAQFQSILRGIESSMVAAEFEPVRMSHEEMFLEIQTTISPFCPVRAKLRNHPLSVRYISAREQLMNAGIDGMTESYVCIDHLLWSVVTMKSPPDQTWPGLVRELQTLGFPLIISTNIFIPNQTKVLEVYKRRHKKMIAAQVEPSRQPPARHECACGGRGSRKYPGAHHEQLHQSLSRVGVHCLSHVAAICVGGATVGCRATDSGPPGT